MSSFIYSVNWTLFVIIRVNAPTVEMTERQSGQVKKSVCKVEDTGWTIL